MRLFPGELNVLIVYPLYSSVAINSILGRFSKVTFFPISQFEKLVA
jgi:hypothetical protein